MSRSYVAIFRTHIWDNRIAALAERARACCSSGQFVVAADETNGPLHIDAFTKLTHTEDFSEFGLPKFPIDRVLWWNADYVLYAARRAMPEYEYYVMLEYDVFLNCDVDRVIAECSKSKVDFVAQDIRRIGRDDHWSSASAGDMGSDLWWALIPLIVVSGRAVDEMLRKRQTLATALAAGQISNWPYCEPFMPTAVAQRSEFTSCQLDSLVDSKLLQFRPFLSTHDPRLRKAEIVAHPVSNRRFIEDFVAHSPQGSYYMTDGSLRPELQNEELDNLQAILGDRVRDQRDPDGRWRVTESIVPHEPEIFRPWIDLADGKPAIQSSHSRHFSHGPSSEADAALANRDPLPDDYAFHTETEENPWWQVDLLQVCIVERVEIINRVTQPLKFNHFRIDISQNEKEWTTCFRKIDNAVVSSDPLYPARFTLNKQVQARYVRIIQLGMNCMHLRRVRVLGFQLIPSAPGAIELLNGATFARLLAVPDNRETLADTVESIVYRRVFGRGYDSYDIEKVAFLTACIDSGLYAVSHMADAQRFPDAGALQDYAVACTPSTGMVLEFGVFSGKSINRIAGQMPGRRVYGFDSFKGLPETWRPGFEEGAFGLAELPAVATNVELMVGWFDNTLPAFVASNIHEKIAFLHIDCDLYSSTKTIFSFLADWIVPGTIILFDEYFNYPEWRLHEYKAFQELKLTHAIGYEYIGFVPSHQQVAVRVTDVGSIRSCGFI